MAITMAATRAAALDDLDFRWGDLYDFAFNRAKWVARTRDGARTLLGDDPEELRGLIEADYEARPVPRRETYKGRSALGQKQAQALKELDVHWGAFYVISLGSRGWMAKRSGNRHLLVAATPGDLEELIEADAGAQQVRLAAHGC
jgi:hypothetical protein